MTPLRRSLCSLEDQDRLVLRGVRFWAHVGVLQSERDLGQWFELDLDIPYFLQSAAVTDDVTKSLDYSAIIVELYRRSRHCRCQTLECLCDWVYRIAEDLYGPLCVIVEIRKPSPPIAGFSGSVGVRRVYRRSDDLFRFAAEQGPAKE